MSKKSTLIITIGLIIAVAGLAGFYFFRQQEPKAFADEMTGKIVEVKPDSVVVEGYLRLPDTQARKLVTVEFTLASDTRLIKKALQVGGHEPGVAYTPEITESVGQISDLKSQMTINAIKSKRNLVGRNQAAATEINYMVMSYGQ